MHRVEHQDEEADPEREPQDLADSTCIRSSFADAPPIACRRSLRVSTRRCDATSPCRGRSVVADRGGGGPACGTTGGAWRRAGPLSPTSWAWSTAGAGRRAARPPAGSAVVRGRAPGCAPASASRTSWRAPPARAFEQPLPLPRRQRRRRRDREPHLHARVRRVGVLTAGTTRTGGAPLELVEADDARRIHAQDATFRDGCTRVARAGVGHGGLGYRPVTFGWARPGGSERMSSAAVSRVRVAATSPRWQLPVALASATAFLVGSAPSASAASRPKPGGSVTYGLEAGDRRWLVPVERPPGDLRHRGGRRRSTTRSWCPTPRTRWCRTSRSRSSPTPTSPSGRSRSVTASSSTTARRSTARRWCATSTSTARAPLIGAALKRRSARSPPPARSRSP